MERKEECLITVKEIEIFVTAKVEEAVKEFKKLAPNIVKTVQQVQENFKKIDTKVVINKFNKAIQFVKKKIEDLKKSNQNNEIKINISTKEAQKQISQLEKEINSLQKKVNARQMKLDIINPQTDKVVNDTRNVVTAEGISKNNDTSYSQGKLADFFSVFKGKIEQAQGAIGKMKDRFNMIPSITQNITSNVKKMGLGIKNGLSHILKYVGQLLSLNGIYSVISNSAQSWLSSQNSGAQQLSANIEYLKYSMGSVFAPIIEYVVNLIYQLMKAIQSVVYAFSGINIFAKATASSMGKTASNANKTSKSLSGIHNDINNVSGDDKNGSGNSFGASNMDLSGIENTSNSILDAIKSSNWEEVGSLIGEGINKGLAIIPWDKIKQIAKDIGTNMAFFLNGFIGSADWTKIGNTFAQGLNTVIYIGYGFVTTFNWKQFGLAVGNSINGFFKNIDWAIAGQILGEGIKGIFNSMNTFLVTVDWQALGEGLKTYIQNIDWIGIWNIIKETILNAIGSCIDLAKGLFGENTVDTVIQPIIDIGSGLFELWETNIKPIFESLSIGLESTFSKFMNLYNEYISPFIDTFKTSILTLWNEHLKPLLDNLSELIITLWNNVLKPLIDWFVETLLPVLVPIFESLWNTISSIFGSITNIVNGVVTVFKGIIEFIVGVFSGDWNKAWQGIKDFFSGIWDTIKGIVSYAWNAISGIIITAINTIKAGITTVFNTIKTIIVNVWNAIWGAIKSVINSILAGIEGMANGVVKGINKVISAINNLSFDIPEWVPGVGGNKFGFNIGYIKEVSLPRLAKGNVAYSETMAIFGEYSGASTNPEITTPQNIMRETFESVLANKEWNNNSDRPIRVQIYWGTKAVIDEIIEGINNKVRQTGKAQIKVAYE